MKNLHILIIIAAALVIVAFIARSGARAGKNPGEPTSDTTHTTMAQAQEAPQLSAGDARIIAQTYPTAQTAPSGLRHVVLSPGAGPVAQRGQRLTAHYTGTFLDGKKFDSSRDRNEPFTLTFGVDRVIQGWTEALGSMKKGERRLLIIPWWLAYGETGRGDMIPPKATLVFDVEVLDIK
jgi:FKBP-type peptidyl-prolyl cis-trans isomerase